MQELRASPLLRRLARDGFLLLAAAFVLLRLLGVTPWDRAIDANAYWNTRDGVFYDGSLAGTLGAYLYSPAFAQAIGPLVWLPWTVFLAIWTAILLGHSTRAVLSILRFRQGKWRAIQVGVAPAAAR